MGGEGGVVVAAPPASCARAPPLKANDAAATAHAIPWRLIPELPLTWPRAAHSRFANQKLLRELVPTITTLIVAPLQQRWFGRDRSTSTSSRFFPVSYSLCVSLPGSNTPNSNWENNRPRFGNNSRCAAAQNNAGAVHESVCKSHWKSKGRYDRVCATRFEILTYLILARPPQNRYTQATLLISTTRKVEA